MSNENMQLSIPKVYLFRIRSDEDHRILQSKRLKLIKFVIKIRKHTNRVFEPIGPIGLALLIF